MQQADIVLYDALVSNDILELCRRDSQKIFVGKKRKDHTKTQDEINQLLVDYAKQGHRVLRLKVVIHLSLGEAVKRCSPAKLPIYPIRWSVGLQLRWRQAVMQAYHSHTVVSQLLYDFDGLLSNK